MKNFLAKIKRIKLSAVAIFLIIIACLTIDQDLKLWRKDYRVIEFDVRTYYGYLPAIFIFNDIQLKHPENFRKGDDYYIWAIQAPNGGNVLKMTSGLAILYSPFFFMGHLWAIVGNYESDGFSKPYKKMLLISAIFYLLVGLVYLRKVLKIYFSETVTAITLLALGLGTNLLCYASESAPLSHVYNFTLFMLFIYFSIKWYEKQSFKNTMFLGLLLGLIALIRPSNAIIVLFFIFYGVINFHDLKARIIILLKNYLLILCMAFFAFLVWVPQLIYWKMITGDYIYYSYGNEHFFFNDPKFIDGLFSFRKGWLVYTPMMSFAILGLIFFMKQLKKFRLALYIFIPLNLYIIFSWWCWWYGGSFGQRSIIDSYALLAIPLAGFVNYIQARKLWLRFTFYAVCIFFIWLNIFNTYQFEVHSLHYDSMSKELYFKQFGKMDRISDYDKYVEWADYKKAMQGER